MPYTDQKVGTFLQDSVHFFVPAVVAAYVAGEFTGRLFFSLKARIDEALS